MTDANADIKTYPSLRAAPYSVTTSHEEADFLSQAFIFSERQIGSAWFEHYLWSIYIIKQKPSCVLFLLPLFIHLYKGHLFIQSKVFVFWCHYSELEPVKLDGEVCSHVCAHSSAFHIKDDIMGQSLLGELKSARAEVLWCVRGLIFLGQIT